jgi:hypothetical protein
MRGVHHHTQLVLVFLEFTFIEIKSVQQPVCPPTKVLQAFLFVRPLCIVTVASKLLLLQGACCPAEERDWSRWKIVVDIGTHPTPPPTQAEELVILVSGSATGRWPPVANTLWNCQGWINPSSQRSSHFLELPASNSQHLVYSPGSLSQLETP